MDPFSSPKRTLSRAQHHIADLDARLKTVVNQQPWAGDVERHVNGTANVYKLRLADWFDELPCIVFDAVNNLRACLDQTSYAACLLNLGREPDNRFAYFSIAKDAAHLENSLKGVVNLPAEIRTFFSEFKPYKGGNNTLWALNELANTKKHARLVPMQLYDVTRQTTLGTTTMTVPFVVAKFTFDAEEHKIVLGGSGLKPHPDTNSEITFAIVFDHPSEIIDRQKPVPFLNAIRGEVERVLIGTERLCRRLGLIG